MPPINNKLEAFTKAVMNNADAEAKAILAEVEERRSAAMTAEEHEILNEIYAYFRAESSRLRVESGRKVSRKMLEHKRQLTDYRKTLREKILGDVRARADAYVMSEEYPARLEKDMLETLEVFGADEAVTVYVSERDFRFAERLKKAARSGVTFDVSPEIQMGGLIVLCPGRRQRVDRTFDTSFKEAGERFAELVGLHPEDG